MQAYAPLIREVLTESLIHAGEMMPLLFVVFLLMEAVSHSARLSWISRAMGRPVAGPAAAALLGLLPQCGFSVAATVLWGQGLVPTGSLVASYIATSDEAIPVLFSDPSTMRWVLPLMAAKFGWAVAVGTVVNLVLARRGYPPSDQLPDPPPDPDHLQGRSHPETSPTPTHEGKAARSAHHPHPAGCVGESAGWKNYVPHALSRTARITAMVFVLSSAFNLVGDLVDPGVARLLLGHGFWPPLTAAVFGLIPSCATSVALAEGFRSGFVSFPALLSGLTSNAGMGVLVLAKESRDIKKTLSVVSILVLSAFVAGSLANLLLPL